MEFDNDKIDKTTFAEKISGVEYYRTWKGYDRDILKRLHDKGYIDNPSGKAKSVSLTKAKATSYGGGYVKGLP